MTLEETIVEYHTQLAGEEADAIREQTALINAAAADVQTMVDKHTDSADDFPDGWWLGVVAALGIMGARLRVRLQQLATLRLTAIAVAAVVLMRDSLVESGDDEPLTTASRERLTGAALRGPGGHSWPEWSGKTADDMFRRLASDFRTARTRREVDELVIMARKLATNAATTTTVTAMHAAANNARLMAAGEDGRFTRWRYTAVMDNRTSEICQDLNGTAWAFNDPNAPLPPRHPNCRSVVVPLE